MLYLRWKRSRMEQPAAMIALVGCVANNFSATICSNEAYILCTTDCMVGKFLQQNPSELLSRALFQQPPSELLVTLSMSSSSPVDDIPLGSGHRASRTLSLSKCHPPVSLRQVIGSPNLRLLRRLCDLETRGF